MESAAIIGIDLAKTVFQLHGADVSGRPLFRKKLTREQLRVFLASHPPTIALSSPASLEVEPPIPLRVFDFVDQLLGGVLGLLKVAFVEGVSHSVHGLFEFFPCLGGLRLDLVLVRGEGRVVRVVSVLGGVCFLLLAFPSSSLALSSICSITCSDRHGLPLTAGGWAGCRRRLDAASAADLWTLIAYFSAGQVGQRGLHDGGGLALLDRFQRVGRGWVEGGAGAFVDMGGLLPHPRAR